MSNFAFNFLNNFSRLQNRVLDTLLPEQCVLCNGPADAHGFCTPCERALPRTDRPRCPQCADMVTIESLCSECAYKSAPFSQTHVALDYGWPVDQLVRQWKYGPNIRLSRPLGGLLAKHIGTTRPPDIVVPMPLHKERLMQRGFNQVQLLTRSFPRSWRQRVQSDLVQRIRNTPHQAGMSAHERERALRNAFCVRRPIYGKSVAIIDDVMTTGSSMRSLAESLREAGAADIQCWILARAQSRTRIPDAENTELP